MICVKSSVTFKRFSYGKIRKGPCVDRKGNKGEENIKVNGFYGQIYRIR